MLLRIFLFIICCSSFCRAQDLSGLWVHESSNIPDAMYPIYGIMYLTDNSGQLTGYTYDFQMGSTCSFRLEGEYDSEEKRLIAKNTKKIHKDFLHARSRYKLSYEVIGEDEYLVGRIRQKGVHGFLLSFGGALSFRLKYRKVKPEEYNSIQGYSVIRPHINDAPEISTDGEFDPEIPQEEPVIAEVKETRETRRINRKKKKRKDKLLKSHRVKSRELMLEILDKKYEDGDRISIYVNDVLFQFNVEVKRLPQSFKLTLPANQRVHKVLFVANNLGKLPPNTATIKYRIDEKIYEATLSTDTKENKYLEFIIEY